MPESRSHAAFLRGVNLGRNRRVSGAELRSLFEALGFDDVETFRTSGNVVFGASPERLDEIGNRIERRLAQSLGYEVLVFLRSTAEVRAIAEHQPFDRSLVAASKGKLQVALLPAKPSTRVREDVLARATDENRLGFGTRELYWLPSGAMRDSALDMKTIEKLVGPTTVRTKSTIELIAAKYFAD